MSGLGNKEIFARNLQRYMDERRLSRIELSQMIDVPYSTLSEWLTAKKYPRIDKIEKLAFAFGIEKSDLIEDKHAPNIQSELERFIDRLDPSTGLAFFNGETEMDQETRELILMSLKNTLALSQKLSQNKEKQNED
ncbi:MAG: helix-turn-helix transcriptional regulator [Negativicoccus succinicivorans]|uniref:helix-turn-helix domain-containing protein n=1 Tax=Negativicoccus succinicivorans TaxID=620903 RepID=UPI00290E955B|nr:helix-turn-helix transcriptional regulator [Negativicoccus succinicivorans]MDU5395705.1 helix-turn-helix transcriptional regulator [Negativicoccus succinicivorans]